MCTDPSIIQSQTYLHQMLHVLGKLKSRNKTCLAKNLSFYDTFIGMSAFKKA